MAGIIVGIHIMIMITQNALRGLKDTDPGAATVGVTETTTTISTFSDSREKFSRFVWCDIPGAGTLNVPDWKYFNDQGLFIYDFIVLPYDSRLTTIDIGIIRNCYRFSIPVFVVRSKSDQHISNMVIQKYSIDSEDDEWPLKLKEMRPVYVEETRKDFRNNMRRTAKDAPKGQKVTKVEAKLLERLNVYLVAASQVRAVVNMKTGVEIPKKLKAKLIDEERLVEDMLKYSSLRIVEDAVKEEEEVTAAGTPHDLHPTKLEETAQGLQEPSVEQDNNGAWQYIGADGEKVQC